LFQDNNFFGPSNNGDTDSEDPDAIQFQPDVPTGTPAAAPTTTSSRYPAWLPDTEIKDFDEFLKNTLQQAGDKFSKHFFSVKQFKKARQFYYGWYN
jgi:hypothetical protein